MGEWTAEDLDQFGCADALQLTSRRRDGHSRPWVTMWVVRVGEEVFVRSARGSHNPWYRQAIASGSGRVRVDEIEHNVMFTSVSDEIHESIDDAYRRKYDKFGLQTLRLVTGPAAAAVTIRLVPLDRSKFDA